MKSWVKRNSLMTKLRENIKSKRKIKIKIKEKLVQKSSRKEKSMTTFHNPKRNQSLVDILVKTRNNIDQSSNHSFFHLMECSQIWDQAYSIIWCINNSKFLNIITKHINSSKWWCPLHSNNSQCHRLLLIIRGSWSNTIWTIWTTTATIIMVYERF